MTFTLIYTEIVAFIPILAR